MKIGSQIRILHPHKNQDTDAKKDCIIFSYASERKTKGRQIPKFVLIFFFDTSRVKFIE